MRVYFSLTDQKAKTCIPYPNEPINCVTFRFIGWAMRGEGIPKNSNKAGTKGAACLDSSEIHDRDVAGTVLACWAMAQKCGVAVLRVHDVRVSAINASWFEISF